MVVPAYNEEQALPGVIASLREAQLARPDWRWLTVVVNDGSTDRTRAVLRGLAHRYPLVAINLPINVGIGGAVQAGFQVAVEWGADVTLQFDGDGQHPAASIGELVAPVLDGEADVTVGSRYLAGAGGRSSVARRAGTRLFSWLLRLLLRLKVRDTTSGFRAFGRAAADYISRSYPDDYPEVEVFVPLARAKFRFAELPVQMRARQGGASSLSALRSAYYMIKVPLSLLIHLFKPIPKRREPPQLNS